MTKIIELHKVSIDSLSQVLSVISSLYFRDVQSDL